MDRASLFRRYLPLVALAALQLLIIAVVPSKAPKQLDTVGALPGVGVPGVDTTGSAAPGSPIAGSGTEVTGTTLGGPGATTPSGAPVPTIAGGGATSGTPGATTPASGDRSHCVGDRQFDPKVYPWAPPCAPKFTGDNGGSNNQRGVTKDSIEVVVLRGNYGAAVNAVLASQGSFPSHEQFQAYLAAAADYINAHYELYGRKIHFEEWQLQCTTGGQGNPDEPCLRSEMRKIVAQKNPFAVIWNNAVSSATYDELSQLKVLNIGGYGFSDTFNRNHRPYHWDVQIGGNQLAAQVAQWWCTRMYGGGSAKAVYAGRNANDDMSKRVRRLGVISTNDPENRVIINVVNSELQRRCGTKILNTYFYDQNIQTLQQQRTAAVSNMRGSSPEQAATSVMCFCDQVAPTFLYKTENDQNYFPEQVVVAFGLNDEDSVAHSMDHGAEQPTMAADRYPEYENALGLAQSPQQESLSSDRCARTWHASGRSGTPPYDCADDMDYYGLLAMLIQASGPVLNAANAELGVTRMAPISPSNNADEHLPQRSLAAGDYTWNDVLREVYWSPTRKSAYNGGSGTYVSLNGGRYFPGAQFPAGQLSLPPKPRG